MQQKASVLLRRLLARSGWTHPTGKLQIEEIGALVDPFPFFQQVIVLQGFVRGVMFRKEGQRLPSSWIGRQWAEYMAIIQQFLPFSEFCSTVGNEDVCAAKQGITIWNGSLVTKPVFEGWYGRLLPVVRYIRTYKVTPEQWINMQVQRLKWVVQQGNALEFGVLYSEAAVEGFRQYLLHHHPLAERGSMQTRVNHVTVVK